MGMIIMAVLALLAFAAGVYFVMVYNGLILVKNNIEKAWANIDVLLKQRHDELPKLVDVCRGYMQHEQTIFDQISKARQTLMYAQGPAAKGIAENQLQGTLRQLFALAENYPNLKAQSSFQQVQERVSALESQIADRREFYNDSVNTYNVRIAVLPDVFIAKTLGMEAKEMFKVDAGDRQDVKINFGTKK